MSYLFPSTAAQTTAARTPAVEEWHVLVLFADDTEKDIKGLWGPYSSMDLATAALEELRQWPLDGRWDVRRLNKFVALNACPGSERNLAAAFQPSQ